MKKLICFAVSFCLLSSFGASALETSAKAAAVINADTGEIIYAENADERLPMASTTKIMTALLLCENADMEKEITVTAQMLKVEGSSMGLMPGDRVTYRDLLYGMMLASGNDAANVTAVSLAGTTEKFAEMMNKRAAELGLTQTHFVTPSGLDADGHCTTARELALLAAAALENNDFAKAAASESAVLNYGNPPYRRVLKNHNKILRLFDGAIGVKTGFTKKSGRCLVTAARRDGKTAVAVTLNDPNDWQDHTALLEYGLNSIEQTRFSPPVTGYAIPVIGSDTQEIQIFIEPLTVNTTKTQSIGCKIDLPHFVYAPIAKGDVIGTVVYTFENEEIARIELTAPLSISTADAPEPFLKRVFFNIKFIMQNLCCT